MKDKLDNILKTTITDCFEKGVLDRTDLPDYVIEIPNNSGHGHFASNLAMTLASSQKRSPRDIAKIIIDNLQDHENFLEKVEIAGPGFLNFIISVDEWYNVLDNIIALRNEYGSLKTDSEKKVLVEFVSANPTGPLHLGHGRGAAMGDTLCRILSFEGYSVVREFYINDAGVQISLLGESVYSRWKQADNPGYPFPENGYHGSYIVELANKISEQIDLSAIDPKEAVEICSELGKEIMIEEIRQDLEQFRVSFDVWSYEKDLFSKGLVEKSLDEIKERGELYEKDDAQWINTSDYGDDKDRVVKKQDGQYTYFASDISYHLEKYKRGFDHAINIWGADHHGYVRRIKSALKADGLDESWLSVILIQLVKLWEAGQEVKMSKRSGQFVTLKELVDDVGVDAVRFVFLTKSHDSPLDFNIDLVKKQDSENPVYYVQYAHARICSIFNKADEQGISMTGSPDKILSRLKLDEEMRLIRYMAEFPSVLKEICVTFEAHRLTYYLTELAAMFHRYFNMGTSNPENRIIVEDKILSQARLFLVDAVRIVIKNGLNLLGCNAPKRM